MKRWIGTFLNTIAASLAVLMVLSVVIVVALAMTSAQTGLSSSAIVRSALNKVQDYIGTGEGRLTRVSENMVSLRGEFSRAFFALEQRVQTLEQQVGAGYPPAMPQKTGGFIRAQLQAPPLAAPPKAAFGGAISEDMLRRDPINSPPTIKVKASNTPDVCYSGCRYQTLRAAYRDVRAGDTITLAPGFYTECLVVKKSIAIVGLKGPNGERAEFTAQCRGKGAFVVQTDQFELRGVAIRDVSVRDNNGACVRLDPQTGTVRVSDIVCSNSQNGILGSARKAIFIDSSLFVGNGGAGRAHAIYVQSTPELVVRNSIIQSTKGAGHTLKSGAERTIVQNSILAALDSENSRAIDLFAGGTLIVTDSVLEQGPNSQNHDVVYFAGEASRINLSAEHIALFENNWIIYDYKEGRCCRWLAAGKKLAPIIFRHNKLVGINSQNLEGLEMEDNLEFEDRAAAGLPPYTGQLDSLPFPAAWK